ncbi:MAG: leucine--tRNA ligase [Patescibacteria group bacterium]|nr:leucine--tRNA ligase [Patescibacteria group bacterium]
MNKYDSGKIEKKWQKYWQQKKIFQAKDFSKSAGQQTKKYVLVEFPYPSGEGLHMGHLRPYVAGDVYSRFKRMQGHNVMYPIGWDAFGLPAENFAIKHGVHPSVSTAKNIKNAKRQIQSWGLSFDWSREINTTDPNYYKWTQWIFLQFFKAGLAYEATGMINWCPKDKTGLANEEVIDGKCERCGSIVEKKELRQWYLKITAYAEKLLEGLKTLDWPDRVKVQQENWIGKSIGAEIDFAISQPRVRRFVILHGRASTSKDNFYPWLKKELEASGFEIQALDMPGKGEPDDLEQAKFVMKNCMLDENTVVIGHSFGGVVALRLLEQGMKLNKVILVATPFSGKFLDGKQRVSVSKAVQKGFDFGKIKNSCQNFTLLYGTNDPVVPLSDGEEFSRLLNVNLTKIQSSGPHFQSKEEPEVFKACLPSLKVFTTRPDTIFGATYMVVAPEHPIIRNLESGIRNYEEVQKYVEKAKKESEIQRTSLEKEKTGVELKGIKAVNPATGEEIPVWVADYVLWGYGTGAIMAVPAHDGRDFEFAKKFGLPIKSVIEYNPSPHKGREIPGNTAEPSPLMRGDVASASEATERLQSAAIDYGILINSGKFTGMKSEEAIPKMAAEFGKLTVQYKLRDWVFSRQRYWGEPIPIIHCEKCGIVPVPEKDLPVKLPPVKKYEPTGTGESPLAAISNWVNVKCPECKEPAKRETNTMPQWAGSSWYWLRYTDPGDKKIFADKKKQKYWTPVDVYFGGMEHTTLHLLYSRFWNLFLYDQGLVTAKEPFAQRKPHGIVLAADGEKMSKSRGNVVNPDDIVKSQGADTLRMYEMFLGPHELSVSWNDQGVVGIRRFLDRVWVWTNEQFKNKKIERLKDSEKVERVLHKLIKKVTEDLEEQRFNTAIASFMEFHNEIKQEPVSLKTIKTFLTLLYPFAPHIAEELNQMLGGKKSLQLEAWPKYDPAKVVEQTAEVVVQVNGRVRGKVSVPAGSGEDAVKAEALKQDAVAKQIAGIGIKRVIYVKDKLINLVI